MDELRRARELDDVLVFGGGIIPDADIATLKEQGVAASLHAGLVDQRDRQTGSQVDPPRRTTGKKEVASGSVRVPGQAVLRPLRHPVSPGGVADTVDEAVAQADAAGYPVVVKAQVQVGGPGKAGGIKLANNADEVRTHAGNILGMDIKGHVVQRVWIEHASDIAEEYYASFTLDRGGQAAPGHGVGPGRRRHRAGRREGPGRHRPVHIDPVDGLSDDARPAGWPTGAKLDPKRGRRRRRHPGQAVPAASSTATPTWSRSTR